MEATATDTYTVDERCIEVVTRARVASAEIRVLLNGVEVDRHPAAIVLEANPGNVDPRPLRAESDRCQQAYDTVRHFPSCRCTDLRDPHDPDTKRELEFATTTTGSLEVGVELPTKPAIAMKFAVERTTKTTTNITTNLLPSERYVSYEPGPRESLEWCWTTA